MERPLVIALLCVLAAACLAGCGIEGTLAPPPPTETTEGSTQRTAAEASAADQAQRDRRPVRLGGDRDLDDLVMIAADDVDDVDVAVEVPDGPYTDYWGLCLGYMDVELMREQYASEDVTYCEKSGIVVLELPVADELFLSVGNRSAMRPEVRTYVEALIEDLPGALAADTWPGSIDDDGAALISAEFARFVDQQRELGVQPLY